MLKLPYEEREERQRALVERVVLTVGMLVGVAAMVAQCVTR